MIDILRHVVNCDLTQISALKVIFIYTLLN